MTSTDQQGPPPAGEEERTQTAADSPPGTKPRVATRADRKTTPADALKAMASGFVRSAPGEPSRQFAQRVYEVAHDLPEGALDGLTTREWAGEAVKRNPMLRATAAGGAGPGTPVPPSWNRRPGGRSPRERTPEERGWRMIPPRGVTEQEHLRAVTRTLAEAEGVDADDLGFQDAGSGDSMEARVDNYRAWSLRSSPSLHDALGRARAEADELDLDPDAVEASRRRYGHALGGQRQGATVSTQSLLAAGFRQAREAERRRRAAGER